MQGLTVQNQSFIVVSSESNDFKDEPNDGLIGMGFSSIAVSGEPTFFENLIQTQRVAKPEFSLYLARGSVSGSEVSSYGLWLMILSLRSEALSRLL